MIKRTNPGHWIWQQTFPHRFDPDEEPYLVLRESISPEQRVQMEVLISEGMSAEQIAALCQLDQVLPPDVVAFFGAALAFWIQRAHEGVI